jgi:hypothetical protein
VKCQGFKLMIMYELHGLNDIAVDTLERFTDRLKGRIDTEQAIRLFADPHCDRCAGSFATREARCGGGCEMPLRLPSRDIQAGTFE